MELYFNCIILPELATVLQYRPKESLARCVLINDAPCRHLSITCSTRKEVAQHSIGTYCKTINGTSEKGLKQALQGNAKRTFYDHAGRKGCRSGGFWGIGNRYVAGLFNKRRSKTITAKITGGIHVSGTGESIYQADEDG